LDDEAGKMDTEFVDSYLNQGKAEPLDHEVVAAMKQEEEDNRLTPEEEAQLEKEMDEFLNLLHTETDKEEPRQPSEWELRLQQEAERARAAKEKMAQVTELLDSDSEEDRLKAMVLAMGEEQARRRGLIEWSARSPAKSRKEDTPPFSNGRVSTDKIPHREDQRLRADLKSHKNERSLKSTANTKF